MMQSLRNMPLEYINNMNKIVISMYIIYYIIFNLRSKPYHCISLGTHQ